jgi:cell volume regulation protein A
MGLDWRQGLLLGAIVGSTDAAAVFSVLRHAGLRLHERVAATLEVESGLNDPMAVFLVLALVGTISADAGPADVVWLFVRQAGIGAGVGWFGGAAVAWLLRRLPVTAEHGGLLSLLIVSGGFVLYATCGFVEGSGFLAAYLYGLRVRALAETAAHAASSALDGFAWAAQATMFLLLGLLVSPHEMLRGPWHTVAIAAVLMFVARPVAVLLCLAPFRFRLREMLFISWVGLRGAVPIVLALIPVLARVPGSNRAFNVAFAVVLASLLLQGTTLRPVAERLRIVEPPEQPPPGEGAVHGRLLIDADLPLADVFGFFQLPLPPNATDTLGDWMTQTMARDRTEGDGLAWHGAHFRIAALQDERIARVAVTLAPRPG